RECGHRAQPAVAVAEDGAELAVHPAPGAPVPPAAGEDAEGETAHAIAALEHPPRRGRLPAAVGDQRHVLGEEALDRGEIAAARRLEEGLDEAAVLRLRRTEAGAGG